MSLAEHSVSGDERAAAAHGSAASYGSQLLWEELSGSAGRLALAEDAYIGAGSRNALAHSFINQGQLAHVALAFDGIIVYASASMSRTSTWNPSDVVGHNVFDYVHPDDAERALLQLTELTVGGSTPGAAVFRIRRVDGTWLPVEVLASIVDDGEERLIGLWFRDAQHQLFLEDLLAGLVAGAPRTSLLEPVCNAIPWAELGSHIAIAWGEHGMWRVVSTGIPTGLAGGDAEVVSPWATARVDGCAKQGTVADLDDRRRRLANALGFGAYWIEPVHWDRDEPPALITIWTAAGPRAPAIHAYGMGVARNLVGLVLRWTEQTERLRRAARLDSLTEVSNHRSFFTSLADMSGMGGGAVLYCDLDHFKLVNDRFGHSVGDAVLRISARRLEGCIRAGDIVGRVGGDEFALLCPGVSESGALDIAERVVRVMKEPFHLDGYEQNILVSASVGVARSATSLSEELLVMADRALSEAKAAGRARACMGGPIRVRERLA